MAAMIPPVRRTPHFTARWFLIEPNEQWEVKTTGDTSPSFASYLLEGGRAGVENQDTGDDWADGTWDKPSPERLYLGRYTPGKHVMQAGSDGMEFLCFLKVSPRPPKLTEVVIDGDFIVPAAVALFIISGTVTDGERVFGDYEYMVAPAADAVVNGVAVALLVDGPIR